MSDYRYVVTVKGSFSLEDLTLVGAQPSVDSEGNLEFYSESELVAAFPRGSWSKFIRSGALADEEDES